LKCDGTRAESRFRLLAKRTSPFKSAGASTGSRGVCISASRLCLKCDGTRAETRYSLSAKRTSPFKSAGASVQSTTESQAVRISLQGLYCSCKPVFCSHVTLTGYPLHSLVSPSLLLPASPCAITFQLDFNAGYTMFRGSVNGTGYPLHSPVSPSLHLPASPCAITFQLDSNARYSMFRGSVKGNSYPLHLSVSPSLPLP